MSAKLTVKQQVVYDFVRKEIKRNGYAPSVREICDGVGLSSTSTVHAHLETLRKKGYIKRFPSKNRMIEILEDGFYGALRDHTFVPIVIKITEESPILHEDNISGQYLVPSSYVGDSECFIYSLCGDDSDEKVKAGDLVLVKLLEKATVGELVLAFDLGEAVVKRIEQKKDSKKGIIGRIQALYRRY